MRNKNIIGITLTFALSVVALAGCSQTSTDTSNSPLSIPATTDTEKQTVESKPEKTTSSISSSSSSFTNEYGTATTKCAHSGCDSYIASSGDTNCCIIHSNNCLECGKYIDEDAMYCMSCLTGSSGSSSSSSYSSSSGYSSSSSSSKSSYGSSKCKYKEGGSYVCNKTATDGNFCKEHADYLDNIYSSLFGE